MASSHGVCGRIRGIVMAEEKTKKTKKRKKFWLGYGIYMGILAVLVAVLLVYVWNVMKK